VGQFGGQSCPARFEAQCIELEWVQEIDKDRSVGNSGHFCKSLFGNGQGFKMVDMAKPAALERMNPFFVTGRKTATILHSPEQIGIGTARRKFQKKDH
jgi:hypothetical protein